MPQESGDFHETFHPSTTPDEVKRRLALLGGAAPSSSRAALRKADDD